MTQEIQFDLAWPPSVNKMYVNALESSPNNKRGRYLTKDARSYKKVAVSTIFYTTRAFTFGDDDVSVKIIQFPPDNRKRDRDNGLKIVFDCMEKSGLIINDNQIKNFEIIAGPPLKWGLWKIWMKPCSKCIKFAKFKEYLDSLDLEE